MIVVDVQGVGDLYTDPQIHTANGCEYGEANLGMLDIYIVMKYRRVPKVSVPQK